MIPSGNDKILEVKCKEFAEAVDRVSTISTEKSRAVKLAHRRGGRRQPDRVGDQPGERHRRSRSSRCAIIAEPIEIGFNSRYLLDITEQIEGDGAQFVMSDCGLADDRARPRRPERALCADADAGLSDRVARAGACRVDKKGRQPHINTMLTEAQEAPTSAEALARAGRVGVIRLMLTDFRNYREARLDLGAEPVVLTGPNGAGKTNLLEAISFLAPGRGLRGVRLTEIARRTEIAGTEMDWRAAATCANAAEAAPGRWAVAATIAVRRGTLRLGTGRDPADGDRRLVRIDGEPARSQAALGEEIAILWLTPQMDRLFVEGPGGAAPVSRPPGARPRPGACRAGQRL